MGGVAFSEIKTFFPTRNGTKIQISNYTHKMAFIFIKIMTSAGRVDCLQTSKNMERTMRPEKRPLR